MTALNHTVKTPEHSWSYIGKTKIHFMLKTSNVILYVLSKMSLLFHVKLMQVMFSDVCELLTEGQISMY